MTPAVPGHAEPAAASGLAVEEEPEPITATVGPADANVTVWMVVGAVIAAAALGWVGWVLWGIAVALGIAGWVLCTTAVVTALRHDVQPRVLRTPTTQAGHGAPRTCGDRTRDAAALRHRLNPVGLHLARIGPEWPSFRP